MWEVMKYIMDAAHETIETQRSPHIKGSDKGVASWQRCNIYSATYITSYNALYFAKKTVHY